MTSFTHYLIVLYTPYILDQYTHNSYLLLPILFFITLLNHEYIFTIIGYNQIWLVIHQLVLYFNLFFCSSVTLLMLNYKIYPSKTRAFAYYANEVWDFRTYLILFYSLGKQIKCHWTIKIDKLYLTQYSYGSCHIKLTSMIAISR